MPAISQVEIVMVPETPLRESHDVGIVLQHKIERLEQVERCFVHVDYQERDVDDHDPLTPLAYKTQEAATLPPRERSPHHKSPHAAPSAGGASGVDSEPPPVQLPQMVMAPLATAASAPPSPPTANGPGMLS